MMHRRVSKLLRLIPPVVILSLAPAPAVSDDLDVPAIVRQSPPDPDGDPAQWLNRAIDLFDQGALANEMNGARPVTKWSGPIDIAVRGDAGRTWLGRVEQIAGDLSHVTGRSITVDDNPLWAGDMDIYVTNRAAYWPFFVEPANGVKDQPFTCIALPSTLNGEIRGSKIHINAGVMSPDGVSACLLEEIFQSMGFFGEAPDHPETVLNDDVGYRELGFMDRLLLRTLYDPRLSTGMTRDRALPLARLILKEHLERGP